jgi:hypothetical protein
LDLFTLRHSVCYFFCFGSLTVDPVDGTLNYVIALLLSPIIRGSEILSTIGSLLRGLPELASALSDVEPLPLEDVENEEDASAM